MSSPTDESFFKLVRKYDKTCKRVRRQSSTEWGTFSKEEDNFALVLNTDEEFKASINLGYFPQFAPEDIEVEVYGYDLQIWAQKNDENEKAYPRRMSRQYRMPPDVDLDTLTMQRSNEEKLAIVEAKKRVGFGKDVQLSVVDVTSHRPTIALRMMRLPNTIMQ